MTTEPRVKKSRLDIVARFIQIITGLSIIIGIIVAIIGIINTHEQAKMAIRSMKLSSLQYINQLIDNDTLVRNKINKFISDMKSGVIPTPKKLLLKYKTGELVYLSPELSDFRDIFRHYEQLGAKVKLQYIDSDLVYEVIPFPDNLWDLTTELRCRIQYNWYGEGKEMKDYGSNFSALKEFYDHKRGPDPFPYMNLLEKISNKIEGSNQVLLVINEEMTSDHCKVYALEKSPDGWRQVFGPMDAFIGENGFIAPEKKQEGDCKTPAGIYPLRTTFGYSSTIKSKMPYIQVTDDDIWVTDSNADDYNKLVKRSKKNVTNYENMKRDDDLYQYGIVIEYNTNPVVKGRGSAIFFHNLGWPCTTTGCVALREGNLRELLEWLNPSKKPVAILGTKEMLESLLSNSKE